MADSTITLELKSSVIEKKAGRPKDQTPKQNETDTINQRQSKSQTLGSQSTKARTDDIKSKINSSMKPPSDHSHCEQMIKIA